MSPCSQSDGHDAPRLIGEAVPGEAAIIEDVVVGFEDAVRQPVISHELPDVFDRIELGAFRRQWQQGDVGRDDRGLSSNGTENLHKRTTKAGAPRRRDISAGLLFRTAAGYVVSEMDPDYRVAWPGAYPSDNQLRHSYSR